MSKMNNLCLLLGEIIPLPLSSLIWLVAFIVGAAVFFGGLRGVLYTEAMQGVVMLIGILSSFKSFSSHFRL